jgi:tetratricopeptide (TPR) repeat protein
MHAPTPDESLPPEVQAAAESPAPPEHASEPRLELGERTAPPAEEVAPAPLTVTAEPGFAAFPLPPAEPVPPAYELHSPGDVAWATFWGGPLAGALVLAINYVRLGRRRAAAWAAVGGLLATGTLVAVRTALPITACVPGLVALLAMWQTARALQGNAYERHLELGGRKASGWWAFGLGLLSAALVLLVAFAGGFAYDSFPVRGWGSKLVIAPEEEVYYTGGVTEAEARQLGQSLRTFGYFDGRSPGAARLSKTEDGIGVDLIVRPWVVHDAGLVGSYEQFARQLAADVYPGQQVTVRLCDEYFAVRKVLPPVTAVPEGPWREPFDAGVGALKEGCYAEAAKQFREAVTEAERFGPRDPRLAASLYNLALAHYHQGNYAEADPLYQRALGVAEGAWGPENPALARYLIGLADLRRLRGSYAEAERLYRRALAVREKGPGGEHADVADSLNCLALLCIQLGRYDEAEPLCRRARDLTGREPGEETCARAHSLRASALLAHARGRHTEAEPLYQQALHAAEQAAGPEDPETAWCLDGLAGLYADLERFDQAEQLYQRALHIREKAFGRGHPEVADTLTSLARLSVAQEKYGAAESLARQALAVCEKALGPGHAQVADCLHELAPLLYVQGKVAEAGQAARRALAIREKALGAEHPAVAASLNLLASMEVDQGHGAQAEPLLERSVAIEKKVLGADHPALAPSLNNLGVLYEARGKDVAAAQLFQQALTLFETAYGKEHAKLIPVLQNYARVLRKTGRAEKARELEARAQAILKKHLKPEPRDSYRQRLLTRAGRRSGAAAAAAVRAS